MSSSSPQVLDPQAIENLRSLGDEGDDSFVREIIGIYLEDLPLRIAALKSARLTGDTALYTRSAHTIKGSSANVGAAEVQKLAERLEHQSKKDPLAALDGQLDELEAACERARTALQAFLE
jgi:HPt (histidine-containing phosphotransfer) domain-containing protein